MTYRYPQNVILDIKKPGLTFSSDYWIVNYAQSFSQKNYFSTTLGLMTNFKLSNKSLLSTGKKSTVFLYNTNNYVSTLAPKVTNLTKQQLRMRDLKTTYFQKKPALPNTKTALHNLPGKLNWADRSKTINSSDTHSVRSLVRSLFDINFIKKERLYTKLKYSRSPAYDIVSGGAAALLAGFIGFLISEKFGIELVDSGDFYIAFMYVVFLSFAVRPLLRSLTQHQTSWLLISPNFLFDYIYTIIHFVLITVKGVSSKLYINTKPFSTRLQFIGALVVAFFFIW